MKQIELMQKSFHRLFTFWPLFLIYLSTILSIQFLGTIKLTGMASSVLGLVNFLLFFFSVSFSVSLPYFFDHKNVSFEDGLDTILENTKRLFFPILILRGFSLFLLWITLSYFIKSLHLTRETFQVFFSNFLFSELPNILTPIYVRIPLTLFLILTPSFFFSVILYFSLEKKGIFVSLWKAFHYGRNHVDLVLSTAVYLSIVFLINFFATMPLRMVLPYTFTIPLQNTLMFSTLYVFEIFFLTSYVYEYWKSHKE